MKRINQILAAVAAHKGNKALRNSSDPFSLGFKMGALWADLNPQTLASLKLRSGRYVYTLEIATKKGTRIETVHSNLRSYDGVLSKVASRYHVRLSDVALLSFYDRTADQELSAKGGAA